MKYLHDVSCFAKFASGRAVDKSLTRDYKAFLESHYNLSGANSMLAALNVFLKFAEWFDCCVKQFKVQKKIFCPAEKELSKSEYLRLVEAARKRGNARLSLLLQTVCGTGIRVSELKCITVEAVQRGEAEVFCKGKCRTVFLVPALRKKLLQFVKENGICTGCVFITRNGNPLNRSNIWREMKSLCKQAGVSEKKVFPHNLRHLFARTFYRLEKDIAKLADILGHSSINTTRIYTIASGAEHKRRMENMRLII